MTGDLAASAVKTVGALLVVLGIIICLFYLIKRFRLGAAGGRAPDMRLLGTLSLGPKRAVALVEVLDRWLVVGVGADTVTLLTSMERPEGAPPRTEGGGADFRSILKRRTGAEASTDQPGPGG